MARVKIGNVYPTDEYLLARCAPAGYGLGEELPIVDKAGLDNWISSGWCIYYDAFNKDSTLGGSAFVNCKGNNSSITGAVIQEAHQQDGYGVNTLTRAYIGGEWTPWEYINPPMLLGEEYRTTERWQGKPVYTKLFNFGLSANGASIPHELNPNPIVRYSAVAGSIPLPHFNTVEPGYQITVSVGATNITMACGEGRTGLQTYVQLWYTKN